MIEKNLWKQSRSHRGLLAASSICGILCAIAIAGQAFTLAQIIAAVFLQAASLESLLPQMIQLFILVTLRVVLQILEEHLSFLLGQKVQYDLRKRMLQKIDKMGPVAFASGRKRENPLFAE